MSAQPLQYPLISPTPFQPQQPQLRRVTPGQPRPGAQTRTDFVGRDQPSSGVAGRSSRAANRPQDGAQLRILPVPASAPAPSGRTRGGRIEAGQSELDLSATTGATAAPRTRVALAQPEPSPEPMPDPAKTVATLAPAVMEVLNGLRPAAQLVRWTSHDVHVALSRRAAIAARMGRQSAPGRAPVVRAVRVSRPSDTVAETSAVVVDADRIRAVAIRLEAVDRRWRATALEVG